ncbi:hypothetical protein RsTz2092_00100 [Deferribacterales bacterium RsTz2092]|nr:hypothetical protein AGMMS49941_00410 [Deferribacterales bacterium]
MQLSKRLKKIREHCELSQDKFAEKSGINVARIRNIERGQLQKFNDQEISLLSDMGFSRVWLITGEGEPLKHETAAIELSDDTITLPHYEHVTPSAGYGLEMADETPDGEYKMSAKMFGIKGAAKSTVIMHVSGYSMAPRLDDGDGILVNIKENTLQNEGIYVLRWGGSLLVKTVQKIKDGIRLISYNPNFAPVELTGEECSDVQIIGRVIGMFAKI